MADANSVTFWTEVATAYKNDGKVLFELYNEPNQVGGPEWLNGSSGAADDYGCKTVGMQALYNAVRATGAPNLVVIGGTDYAFDLSIVAIYPVSGYNIVYATHPYNEGDKQMAASSAGIGWDAAFGYLTTKYPVMITEFGDDTSCSGTWNQSVIDYANKSGSDIPANEISWSAYGWWVGSCTFPSLISDWSGTPTAPGTVVQTALTAY
jgi:hypothetical protein